MPVKVRTIHGHDWLPVGVAAAELSYSPATVRRLCARRQLVFTVDQSNYRWISRESVEAAKTRFTALVTAPSFSDADAE